MTYMLHLSTQGLALELFFGWPWPLEGCPRAAPPGPHLKQSHTMPLLLMESLCLVSAMPYLRTWTSDPHLPLGNSSLLGRIGAILILDGSLPALSPDPNPGETYSQFLDFCTCGLFMWPEVILIHLLELSNYTKGPYPQLFFWITMRKC